MLPPYLVAEDYPGGGLPERQDSVLNGSHRLRRGSTGECICKSIAAEILKCGSTAVTDMEQNEKSIYSSVNL